MEKVKTIYFSYFPKRLQRVMSRLADALKLNYLMKLHEIKGQDHYSTFGKRHTVFKLKSCFSQKLLSYLKYHVKASGSSGKNIQLGLVT